MRSLVGRRLRAPQRIGWAAAGDAALMLGTLGAYALVARELGAAQFGIYAAIAALTSLAQPFNAFGSGHLLVRTRSTTHVPAATAWSWALRRQFQSSALLILVLSLAGALIMNAAPAPAILLICAADLGPAALVQLATQEKMAEGRYGKVAALNAALGCSKFIAAIMLATTSPAPSVTVWAFWYLAASLGALLIGLFFRLVRRPERYTIGSPPHAWPLRQGIPFSITQLLNGIANDLDKVLLVAFGVLSGTGQYSAAYRVVTAALFPLRALQSAMYPRFFAAGAKNARSGFALAKKATIASAAVSALLGVAVALGAPLIPAVLGESYAGSEQYVRLLAVFPMLKCLQWFAADALTGHGRQGPRAFLQGIAAAFTVGLLCISIPAYGVMGALLTTIAVEMGFAVALWAMLYASVREEDKSVSAKSSQGLET